MLQYHGIMKFSINRIPVRGPWGGGNMFTSAFYEHVPAMGHVVLKQEQMGDVPDVVVLAGLQQEHGSFSAEQAILYKTTMSFLGKDVKLLLRINENDARKGTTDVDRTVESIAQHVDGIVFVSQWLKDYFEERNDWPGSDKVISTVIVNGVDSNVFKAAPKFNNDKVNIVAHHWSDNVKKGFDFYEKIDEFVGQNSDHFTFTYIGRDRRTFKNTKVISPLHGQKLGDELGKYDVYVSASRFDPGPNHVLEALSCELPTYVHVDGGGCVEFAGKDHVFNDWDELKARLIGQGFRKNDAVKLSDWKTCIKEYILFSERLCQKPNQNE